MNRLFLACALLLTVASLAAAQTPEIVLTPAKECQPRQGWPHFFRRVQKSGGALKIGYLGGSITAQPGWRPKTLAYFQKTYPGTQFSEINAAIGGTGSDLGVFRLQKDMLSKKPDLLFVEFAVNDSGAPPEQITRCMEGIVRQTRKTLPECDLCFVYTVTETTFAPLMEGKSPRAATVMEQIADRYGIPSIHLATEVARLAKEGKLVWQAPLPKTDAEKAALGDKIVFAGDGVHPYPETGHELYTQAIIRSLEPIKAASKGRRTAKLPAPLNAANYEGAILIPLTPELLSSGFVKLDPATDPVAKSLAEMTGGLYRGNKPGESLTFRFWGTYAALYDVIGPDCGQVIVTLDNQAPRIVPRFDAFCQYFRLATLLIGADLPDTEHTVRIEIHPMQPDKVKILATRQEIMDRPERYNGTAFYPGALLLVGKLR
ncbi:MAG: SGNH/GDSL hydrolase family protein [Armatimonas sp.]